MSATLLPRASAGCARSAARAMATLAVDTLWQFTYEDRITVGASLHPRNLHGMPLWHDMHLYETKRRDRGWAESDPGDISPMPAASEYHPSGSSISVPRGVR